MSNDGQKAETKSRTSKLAIAALATGIIACVSLAVLVLMFFECIPRTVRAHEPLGCTLLLGFVAVGLGRAALGTISASRGRARGAGLAIGGRVLGAITVLAILLGGFVVLPRLSCLREGARRMHCACNLRQIGLGLKQYAQDNNEQFPPYFDALYPDYVDSPKMFSCLRKPSKWQEIQRTGKVKPEYTSYVYVSGLNDTDPAGCILLYCRPGNHSQAFTYVTFLDTHTEWMSLEKFKGFLDETRRLVREKCREIKLIGE